ncbi:hypothetical protein F0310_04310 (plasmid) [Borrelia sp. A-FGy1]|uniref:hypothetical protein n=1 Tax=Borrelia sp. A-FGy1 TaxID=2608247 RepID=UPI0015F3C3BF|nr:hypothetical protein [Borrelia sp. A-FGy1]QMU99641.1 hypothetical protein F0310_04310 [Borrelia sp. A-FGy1]
MKMYRVLFILLVIVMSCGQQTSNKEDKNHKKILKTKKQKRNRGTVGQGNDVKKADKDSDFAVVGEQMSAPYYMLERKVKALRGKLESARSIFIKQGHSFPNLVDSKSIVKAVMSRQHSFPTIVSVFLYEYGAESLPERVDEFYAGLGYDVAFITKLEEICYELIAYKPGNLDEFGGKYYFCEEIIFPMINAYNLNQKILYEYFSDTNLVKLKSDNNPENIAKANKLLGEYIKIRVNVLDRMAEQMEIVRKSNKGAEIYNKFTKIYDEKILFFTYGKLNKIGNDIEKFFLNLKNDLQRKFRKKLEG